MERTTAQAHQTEAPEQAAAPAVAEAVLSPAALPARILALQRTIGNQAVGRVLARQPGPVLARRPTVSDEVFRVTQELNKKQPPDEATIKDAVEVAKSAYAEVQSRKAATTPDTDKIAEAYDEVRKVISSLVANQAEDAAIDFAKTCDATVQTQALNALRNSYQGVDKQQKFILKAARLAGTTVAAPTALQTSSDWLEKQTKATGETFRKLEDKGLKGLQNETLPLALALASQLLEQYFSHSPTDVKPEATGSIAKLKVDAAKKLESDCDVYATYGARLLRAAGWTTVGYMAIVPDESTGRDAHAVMLAKRTEGSTTTYLSLSNAEIKTFTAADDDSARDPLLTHGLDIYKDPKPAKWKAYYAAAGAGGAFDLKLLDPAKHNLTAYKQQT